MRLIDADKIKDTIKITEAQMLNDESTIKGEDHIKLLKMVSTLFTNLIDATPTSEGKLTSKEMSFCENAYGNGYAKGYEKGLNRDNSDYTKLLLKYQECRNALCMTCGELVFNERTGVCKSCKWKEDSE